MQYITRVQEVISIQQIKIELKMNNNHDQKFYLNLVVDKPSFVDGSHKLCEPF